MRIRWPVQEEAGDAGAGGGGAAAAGADAGAGAGGAGAGQGAGAGAGTSLTGAPQGGDAGASAGGDKGAGASDRPPLDQLVAEQYRRRNADNKLDLEETLRAVEAARVELATRMRDTGLPPKEAKEYALGKLPDGVKADEAELNMYRQAAHEAGLTKKQFETVTGLILARSAEVLPKRFEEFLASKAEGITTTLNGRVGVEKAKQMLADAEYVWQQIAPEGAPRNAVLQDPAAVVQALASLAKEMREDKSFETDSRSLMDEADISGLVAKMVTLAEGSPERLKLAGRLKAHSEAKVRAAERAARAGSAA